MTVKRALYFALVFWFASLLAACDRNNAKFVPVTGISTIDPGDRIGDFLITTAEREEEVFSWQMRPTRGEAPDEISVEIEWGKKFNPSIGIYKDAHKSSLDSEWADLTYKMYIEDQPVNLEAFGTVNSVSAELGVVRHWNVAIVAEKPGKIRVHAIGKFKDQSFDDWTTYKVLPP
jgi:hypothetical protein